jgi:hypothetical protein
MLFLIASPALAHGEWRPTPAQIARMEAGLTMPRGASGPLTTYARYYSGDRQRGRRVIVGQLVRLTVAPVSPATVKIVPLADQPTLADFGCGDIHFTYDVARRTLSPLECGGETPPPPRRP